MFLLRFLYHRLVGAYFYVPYRTMIWHSIYSDEHLTTEQRRKLRDDMLPHTWTQKHWRTALSFWDDKCAACGSRGPFHRDHLVPVAHRDCPGAVPSNLLPLCVECNKDKSCYDFAWWYHSKFNRPLGAVLDKIHNWQYYCLERGWQ